MQQMPFAPLHFSLSLKRRSYLLSGLHWISLACRISHSRVHLGLLSLSVFEELLCYLREQGVGQHILILLFPPGALFLKLRQLRRDQVCRSAGNGSLIADDLLLHFRIKRLYSLTELTKHDLLGLLRNHLIALAGNHIHNCLCTYDLRRGSN